MSILARPPDRDSKFSTSAPTHPWLGYLRNVRKGAWGESRRRRRLDFTSFRSEIKRELSSAICQSGQRSDWESFLSDEGARVRRPTSEIKRAEREVDRIVYGLFDLSPNEIETLEASLVGQDW
jgi:hypothetical protein